MSNQRYIILTFVSGAIVLGLTTNSAVSELLAALGWPDPLLLGIVAASTVVGVLAGVVTFVVLLRNQKAVSFTDEVIVEVRKVFWPKREEVVNATTVVLATSGIIGLSLAFYDFVWAKVTNLFLYTS
ncbi:MAG: preprotein translocase subunit SecE [Deltaproteobacteria bacterium]|nr:preprotein translocase subunit SecE [Deltaproteobacteria bacterium]